MERPERVVLLIIGALFDRMAPVLWVIAVLGNLTVIDRMKHREQVLQAQLQALQQTEPAAQALYDKLTTDQKAVVDHPFHRG